MVLTSQIHSTFSLADWQTRLALGLPIGVGYAPYGWAWGDKDKTFYIIDPETAAVRLSIFVMFVELDMSLRAIAHKLTEDKILTPSDRRKKQQERKRKESQEKEEEEEQPAGWSLTTISSFLQDTSVLGILTVCKQKDIITPEGKNHIFLMKRIGKFLEVSRLSFRLIFTNGRNAKSQVTSKKKVILQRSLKNISLVVMLSARRAITKWVLLPIPSITATTIAVGSA